MKGGGDWRSVARQARAAAEKRGFQVRLQSDSRAIPGLTRLEVYAQGHEEARVLIDLVQLPSSHAASLRLNVSRFDASISADEHATSEDSSSSTLISEAHGMGEEGGGWGGSWMTQLVWDAVMWLQRAWREIGRRLGDSTEDAVHTLDTADTHAGEAHPGDPSSPSHPSQPSDAELLRMRNLGVAHALAPKALASICRCWLGTVETNCIDSVPAIAYLSLYYGSTQVSFPSHTGISPFAQGYLSLYYASTQAKTLRRVDS